MPSLRSSSGLVPSAGHNLRDKIRIRALLLWMVCAVAVPFYAFNFCDAFAQSGPAESAAPRVTSLSGLVQDPTGAIIPGAKVRLLRADGLVVASVLTDGAGQFRLTPLRPGEYQLAVGLNGFQPSTRLLTVAAGVRVPPLLITLELAAVSTNVQVNADDEVAPIAPDQNGDTPGISSDDMKNLPLFDGDPVATLTAMLDTGAAGEGGATLMVDGVEMKAVGVAPSAIQQVTINQDPFSARYYQPGRGQIEITTKSTTDKYHGAFNFLFRDAALNASNYFAKVKPPEQRRIYEGYLTGPVYGLKRTAFLLSINRQEENTYAQIFAYEDPNNQTTVSQQNWAAPTRSTNLSMKVSHQFSDRNFGYVLYQFHDSNAVDQNVGSTTLPSAGFTTHDLDMNIVFHDDFSFGANKLNQFSFLFEKNYDTITSDPQAQQTVVEGTSILCGAQQIAVQGAFTACSAQTDNVQTEYNPNISDMFSWTLGRHQLKFGIQMPNMGRRILEDMADRQGTYTFGKVPNCTPASSTDTSCSPLTAYQLGIASTFTMQQGQERFLTHYLQPGAFFLDQFQLTPRLTITPGIRYDWQNTLSGRKDSFQPRFSIAYLLDKKHAMVLRAGAGIYYRRVGVNIGQLLARYENAAERSLIISNPCYPLSTTCNPVGSTSMTQPNYFEYAPNLKGPMQGYYSVSLERQLNAKSTLTISYNGYRGWHALRSLDINAPLNPAVSIVRPDQTRGQVLQQDSGGYQKSDQFIVNWRGRFGEQFSGMAQYSLSSSHNNTTFSTFTPSNPYAPNAEWSRADWDQRQRLYLLGTFYPAKIYNLGVGVYANSGEPYNETTGLDDYDPNFFNARPIGVGRNSLTTSGYTAVDLRWGYNFKLQPAKKDSSPTMGFSAASFNTFNDVNYSGFVGVVTSKSFMQPTQAFPARRLQLGASYNF